MDILAQPPDSQSSFPAGTGSVRLQRILVATDFSEFSRRALTTAVALARQFDSALVIVHAVSPVVYGTGLEPLPPQPLNLRIEIALTDMKREIAAVPELRAIRHKEIIETGSLPEMVHEISKRQCVDLIVAGSHGADGIEKMLLGSMAEALLRHAACPVLVVGPLASVELSVNSTVYATNLELGSFRSAQFAASLAGKMNSRLTLLHVSQKQVAPTETWMLLADRAAKHLRRLLPADVKDGCTPKIRVEFGDVASEILSVAREEKADLIVMGVREHGGFADHAPWHTLSKVIRKASCPVLAVRGNLLAGKLLHDF